MLTFNFLDFLLLAWSQCSIDLLHIGHKTMRLTVTLRRDNAASTQTTKAL